MRTILYTLTRGEGGQNAMSAESYDALGVIRTNELLKADEYYGAKQVWGTEADFGFSKTQEEAFARWGHERVLYDAVLAVRRERPQVIFATFIGAVSDGHGQHQVSGEIAQEVFKAAGDPKVFPDQLKDGIEPWQPLAVYGMVPFAPINNGKVFDYATGKSAPAKFHNYVTGEWITGAALDRCDHPGGHVGPGAGAQLCADCARGMGRAEVAERRRQSYPERAGHSALSPVGGCAGGGAQIGAERGGGLDLFHNHQGRYRHQPQRPGPPCTGNRLARARSGTHRRRDRGFLKRVPVRSRREDRASARADYRQTLDLRARVAASNLEAQAKASLLFELDAKIAEFQSALEDMLGLELTAFRTNESTVQGGGFRGNSADETPRSVTPGEEFKVRVHVSGLSSGGASAEDLVRKPVERSHGSTARLSAKASDPADFGRHLQPEGRRRTPSPRSRSSRALRSSSLTTTSPTPSGGSGRSLPIPLAAWAEFTFDGVAHPPRRSGADAAARDRAWRILRAAGGHAGDWRDASIRRRAFCPWMAARCPFM